MNSIIKIFNIANISFYKYFFIFTFFFLISSIFEIFGLSLILLFLSEITELGNSNFFENIINQFRNLGFFTEDNYLIIITAVLFLIYLSKNILLFALEIFKNKFFAKLHNKLSVKLYMRFINLDFQIYSRISSASLLNNINSEIEKIFQETMDALYTIYSEIIIILSLLIFLLFFDPTVTIMTLTVFSISGISFKIILGNKHKFWGKKRRLSLEQIIFSVQKTYNSFREIKFIKNQEQFTRKFNNDMHNYTNSLAILKIIQASPRLLFEIIIIFIISLLIFFLIFLNLSNKELLVTASVFAAATIRSAQV